MVITMIIVIIITNNYKEIEDICNGPENSVGV